MTGLSQGRAPRLAGKVAIVTGAGRGIGRAEALLLAREGARVLVNDFGGGSGDGADRSVAASVVQEIRDSGGEAVAETSSVATMAGAQAIVNAAMDAFGRLDILINNAGVTRPLRVDQTPEAVWDAIQDVNLKGSFATIRHAAPLFIAQGAGVIVNTGSPSGFGQYSNTAYAAAKEGLIGLTRSVARDLGQFGIRCNAIRPTASASTMETTAMVEAVKISQERLGIPCAWNRFVDGRLAAARPEHVAALAVWLCTDACGHINGQDMFVVGEEVGLIPEPELTRAIFKPGGWDIESLDDPSTRQYLVGDIAARFTGVAAGPAL